MPVEPHEIKQFQRFYKNAISAPEFKRNQTVLKLYGFGKNRKLKVVTMKSMRTSGLELPPRPHFETSENTDKLEQSISRTKSTIFEIAFCNPWDFFFTGTASPDNFDRSDLESLHGSIYKFFKYRGIKYILVPELHADGKSWHFHGFIRGLDPSELKQFKIGSRMSGKLADKVRAGQTIYDWPAYRKKFGFVDLEPVRSTEAASKYIQKYITKDLARCVTELHAHQYYCSKGLNRAEVIKKGLMLVDIKPTYETEYCAVSWLDYSDELLEQLKQAIL